MIRRILHHFTIQIALWGVLVPLAGCAGDQVLLGANDDKSREPIPAPEVAEEHPNWYPVIGYTLWVILIFGAAGAWWWSGRPSHSSE
jgi:hypothetical protein